MGVFRFGYVPGNVIYGGLALGASRDPLIPADAGIM